MVMKKIIYKDIHKTKTRMAKARKVMTDLRRKGYKNVIVVDAKIIGKGSKIKGIGTRVVAFKGRKPTPKGFRSKLERF